MKYLSIFFILIMTTLVGCQKDQVALCETETFCSLSISPNPSTGSSTQLIWLANEKADYSVHLLNLYGSLEWEATGKMKPGENKLTLPMTDLPAGRYIIQLRSSDNYQNASIVRN